MKVIARSRFDTAPLQLLARVGSGHTPSRNNDDYWIDCDIPWVTTADVKHIRDGRRQVIEDTEVHISRLGMANSSARLHPPGTVVLSRTASVGFSAIMGAAMATSQDFVTWSPGPRIRSRYLLWVLRAMKATGDLDSLMYGSTHKTIYVPDLMDLRVPVPPLEEQRRIADYLDTETARIDTLLTKNTEAATLVEERVAASINSKFDPLSTTWRASVPFRFVSTERDERVGMPETDLPLLSVSIATGVERRNMSNDGQTASSDLSSYKICHPGDVVVNRMRAFQGALGVTMEPGVVSGDYAVLRVDGDPWHTHYMMRSVWFVAEMTRRLRGIGSPDAHSVRTPRINVSDMGDIAVPVRPVPEQATIAAELRELETHSGAVLRQLHRQRDLLRERRQALITSAVTGEIEV